MEFKIEDVSPFAKKVIDNIGKVIVGKQSTLDLVVVCLLSQGHILIDDVPGVGKTMLARSLAKTLGLSFSRIQFTPDMLPSDVTGVSIFNQQSRQFEFRPGPIMAQIVLADEINRATPKTQSALLEAMGERQVTVDGITYQLGNPFMVMGTQNPIEYEGTFPLPEAQLDRFLLRLRMGYPSILDEIKILEEQQLQHPIDTLESVVSLEQLQFMQETVKRVYVAPLIKRYIVELMRATRDHSDIYLGASPRGSLGLYRSAQALAAMRGREYVLPDDIKTLAVPIIAHRVVEEPSARLRQLTTIQIIEEILQNQPVPGGDFSAH